MKKLFVLSFSIFALTLSSTAFAQEKPATAAAASAAKEEPTAASNYKNMSGGFIFGVGTDLGDNGNLFLKMRSQAKKAGGAGADISILDIGSHDNWQVLTGTAGLYISDSFDMLMAFNGTTNTSVSKTNGIIYGFDGLGVGFKHSTGKINLTGHFDRFVDLEQNDGKDRGILSWKVQAEQQIGTLLTLNASFQQGDTGFQEGGLPGESTKFTKATGSLLFNALEGKAAVGVNGSYEQLKRIDGSENSQLVVRATAQVNLGAW